MIGRVADLLPLHPLQSTLTSPAELVTASLLTLVAGLVPVLIGSLVAQVFKVNGATPKPFVASLSVGILLSSFYDLTRETSGLGTSTLRDVTDVINLSAFFLGLVGLFAIHSFAEKSKSSVALIALPYLWSTAGVGFHSVGEGIVIGYGLGTGVLLLSIPQALSFALHKAGEGFTVGALVKAAGLKSVHWAITGLLAGLPTTVGALAALSGLPGVASTYFFALSVGATVYVLTKLVPVANQAGKRSVMGLFLGFLYMYLSGVLHQFA